MKKHQVYMWILGKPWLSTILALYVLRKKSYLNDLGWFHSFHHSLPIDRNGEANPWYAYSATTFLENRVHQGMSVFEYGSGNSTLWWAKRVSHLVSCEHDAQWYTRMQPVLPANVEYIHADLRTGDDYWRTILRYDQNFDLVIVDGLDRLRCAINCLPALSAEGVIVWDDTYREHYRSGYEILAGQGFRSLDFASMGPINAYGMCTSLFYRDGNCLGI